MAQNYYTGGTGKQYVTNEKTGNISVNGKVYSPGQAGYAAARSAMEADTGRKMGGTNVARASNASSSGTSTTPSGSAANSVSSTSAGYTGKPTIDPLDAVNIIRNKAGDAVTVEYSPGKYQVVKQGDPKFEYYNNAYSQIYDPYSDQTSPYWQQRQTYNGRLAEQAGYNQYADIMNQGRDAYEKALRQKLGLAEDVNARAIAATNQAYDQAANNAYIAYMQQQRQMPQQLARMGLAGTGTSESAALGAATNYQNNLNSNEVTRAKALDDLYLALQQNYADAATQQAEYESALSQALANAYLQQYNADRNYDYQRSRDAVNDQWQQRQWEQQLADEEYQRMLDRYGIGLQYNMPTQDIARWLGMDYNTLVNRLNKAYYG